MDTLESLAGSIICRYIEDEDVQMLHAAGNVRLVAAGETLFSEGDEGGSLYVILSGKVHILKQVEGGANRSLAHLQAGDIIGEISLVDASPRSAMARTESDCTLFELSRRDVMGIIRSHPNIAAKLLWAVLETVALRLRDMNAESVRWSFDSGIRMPAKGKL